MNQLRTVAVICRRYAISDVSFHTNWSCNEIISHIKQVFAPKINDQKFELLVPISSRLTKINLEEGMELNGSTLRRVFNQKPIYIRLTENLCDGVDDVVSFKENENIAVPDSPHRVDSSVAQEIDNISNADDFHRVYENVFQENEDMDVTHFSNYTDTEVVTSRDNTNRTINIATASTLVRDAEAQVLCPNITEHSSATSLDSCAQSFSASQSQIDDYAFEPKAVQEIINHIGQKIIEDKISIFNVYREDIYRCCLRAIERKSFSPYHKISVCFTDSSGQSEGAIDAGGPTREMFRLVLNKLKDSKLFSGPDTNKYIAFQKEALQRNEYYNAGRIIVLSIIHAGIPVKFFSEVLFQQILCTVDCVNLTINDVTEDEVRMEIAQAYASNSLCELRTAIIEGTYIRFAGYQNIDDFQKKDIILQDVIKFYVTDRVSSCIEQLREGLKTMDVLKYMKKFPEYFIELFCKCNSNILNAEFFESLCDIQWSEEGSNCRQTESRVVAFFKDYLLDCYDYDTNRLEMVVTLEDLLAFATGTNIVPLFGFSNNLKISFLHGELCPYPKANTCGLMLFLPVVHKEYEEFAMYMTFGVKNGMNFAFA